MDDGTAPVTVTRPGNALVATITGAVDLASFEPTMTRLRAAVAVLPRPDLVVLDLTGVVFFAAAGMHLLTEVANACTRRGMRVRVVVAPTSVVSRVIRIAPLDGLPTFATLAAALAS